MRMAFLLRKGIFSSKTAVVIKSFKFIIKSLSLLEVFLFGGVVYGYGFLQFMFQKEFIFHEELCLTDCLTECQYNASK